MIEVRDLSKRYGNKLAVDHLSFTVAPGSVTGFLGPNGAGKSTTMRMIVGLDYPTSGHATINGLPYAALPRPLRVVGALLEAGAVHPGRTAYNHLLGLAQTQALPRARIDAVVELVGLGDVAHERVGGYSLGMRQRLGIAAALLGDPEVLILDEPVNGLDPDGIFWFRNLMKHLAEGGRTVFVSSHLMTEMALTAENLIVIGRGRLIAQSSTAEFISRNSAHSVLVRTPDAEGLTAAITAGGGTVAVLDDGALSVGLLDAATVGGLASHSGITLFELRPLVATLEEAFMERTHDSRDFTSPSGTGEPPVDGVVPADERSALAGSTP
ncbi:MAG: ATP-binding cassette domain-containing protein [Lapillicoccus sp.]